MDKQQIYRDITSRTGGDIYIGVVGPVRTGKSTFIKKFMENAVIPNITDDNDKMRAKDELPQSAGGKTVMTTEPKFIPKEAVTISTESGIEAKVRMIDCVGYLVPEAIGNTENGEIRMVQTPWHESPIPFEKAAEIGTKRVMEDHSTIGVLVTSDGSYGDIPRSSFIEAEERIARELKSIGKPFAVILNSAEPETEQAEKLAISLEKNYEAPVALVNCTELDSRDINHILKMILDEFPIREIKINMPQWCGALDYDHWLRKAVADSAITSAKSCSKIGEIRDKFEKNFTEMLSKSVSVPCNLSGTASIDMGNGSCSLNISLPDSLYYNTIGELTGVTVTSEKQLISVLKNLSNIKREWEKYSEALNELNEKGYGIVMPKVEDLTLDEPEIIKGNSGYGVKLRATAPSIHLIRASIETEINPIVGSEAQSEELIKSLLSDFTDDPSKIWESNLLGKSLYELVNEGLHAKLEHMPDDARQKLAETLGKIINDGTSGLICILL